MSRPISRSFRLSLLAVGLLGSGMALAEARIDAALVQKLAAAAPTDELQVVITYEQHLGIPTSCFGETSYFVVDVRKALQ